MSYERTLSIIKPDSVGKNNIGSIVTMLEEVGLRIAASKMLQLTEKQAAGFYAVHKERSFFNELVEFMISGPIVVMVLEGDEAIGRYRTLMGNTNPEEAAPDTIRARFGESIGFNAVHGSDSTETAKVEVAYFFSELELVNAAVFN